MKSLLVLIAAMNVCVAHSSELEISILAPDSIVEVTSLDSTAQISFRFPNANIGSSSTIDYRIDDTIGIFDADELLRVLTKKVTPGWHDVQFYHSSDYHEFYSSIEVEKGKHYYYSVYFEESPVMILTEKPVIYLYPESKQRVSVQVTPKGAFTFTYPPYRGGWDVEATPEGKIHVGDDIYNYLFWEGSEPFSDRNITGKKGFVVSGKKTLSFLEEKLSEMGLTTQEQADFITFWVPRMQAHSDVFIQFYFNEACNQFGTLEIEPRPNHINRVYMVWQPIEKLLLHPEPQAIPVFDRSGFNVLEWGGQELPSHQIKTL
jgi:hypothetical protein